MKPLHMIDKAFFLKRSPLFSTLELDVLLIIADKMDLLSFKKGEKLFQIGQEGLRMYLLTDGSVQLKDQNNAPLAELNAGETFGDEALLSEKPRAYAAHALTEVQALSLTRTHLLLILTEYPEVACRFLEAYASSADFRRR